MKAEKGFHVYEVNVDTTPVKLTDGGCQFAVDDISATIFVGGPNVDTDKNGMEVATGGGNNAFEGGRLVSLPHGAEVWAMTSSGSSLVKCFTIR